MRAAANPLISSKFEEAGCEGVRLDTASENGHVEVVRELIQQVGIEGCGGPTRGGQALQMAGKNRLLDAEGVETGRALASAAAFGRTASVSLLLLQRKDDEPAYGTSASGTIRALHSLDSTFRHSRRFSPLPEDREVARGRWSGHYIRGCSPQAPRALSSGERRQHLLPTCSVRSKSLGRKPRRNSCSSLRASAACCYG